MNVIVAIVFAVLWIVALLAFAFLVLARFFDRRTSFALSGVLASSFCVGAVLPRHFLYSAPVRITIAATPVPAGDAPASESPPPPPAPTLTDLGAECRALNTFGSAGAGSLDVARDVLGNSTTVLPPSAASLSGRSSVQVLGWAAARNKLETAKGVCAVIDGRIVRDSSIEYGGNRPDVAAFFGQPSLANTGFQITFALRYLTPGPHTLRVVAISPEGGADYITGQRSFRLDPVTR